MFQVLGVKFLKKLEKITKKLINTLNIGLYFRLKLRIGVNSLNLNSIRAFKIFDKNRIIEMGLVNFNNIPAINFIVERGLF